MSIIPSKAQRIAIFLRSKYGPLVRKAQVAGRRVKSGVRNYLNDDFAAIERKNIKEARSYNRSARLFKTLGINKPEPENVFTVIDQEGNIISSGYDPATGKSVNFDKTIRKAKNVSVGRVQRTVRGVHRVVRKYPWESSIATVIGGAYGAGVAYDMSEKGRRRIRAQKAALKRFLNKHQDEIEGRAKMLADTNFKGVRQDIRRKVRQVWS